MQAVFDIVVLADPRFPGGTSMALAEELEAAAGSGWRTALLPIESAILRYPHAFHPAVRAAIEAGWATLIDPGQPLTAGLILAHHPELFRFQPARPLRVRADHRVLVVHGPPTDAEGVALFDPAEVARNVEEWLGGSVVWAPPGPVVRAQLESRAAPPPLLAQDWVNVIDPERWHVPRDGFVGQRCVIGRHSRPHPLKWPASRAEALEAYPDDPRFLVRVLGGGPFLVELMAPGFPVNWQVLPFAAGAAQAFLGSIDFFIYHHHPRWVEAFGRTVLEALAAGCVAILPPAMAPSFASGARYAERAESPLLALELRQSWQHFAAQVEAGQTLVRERFGHDRHRARLRELLGRPRPAAATTVSRRRARVLFVTTNGVGVGHLTRAMAIARRLEHRLEPVIITMSQALALVRSLGFPAHYLPFHEYLGVGYEIWNHWLRQELGELFALYDPAVIVFDGNMPHAGLVGALAERRSSWAVWTRRAMWQAGADGTALARESAFDCVLEPGDLAAAWDRGPTPTSVSRTRHVSPVRLLDDGDVLPRAAARAELGIPDEATAIMVSLGAGNNYDYRAISHQLGSWLGARPGILAYAVMSPIAASEGAPPAGSRPLRLYPAARLHKAFDAAISAAGYNSFHELLTAGVPTLFVPNENPIMDDQLGRARWAARNGLALVQRTSEPYTLVRRLEELLDPETRADLGARMARLRVANGASAAASLIDELAAVTRLDRG